MEILRKTIRENKPNIAETTVNSYCVNLKTFFYSNNPKKIEFDHKWFDNKQYMLKLLEDEPIVRRSNFLTALIAYDKDNEQYKLSLSGLTSQLKQKKDSQIKSEKEKENWKTFDEIKNIYETLYKTAKPLLKREKGSLDRSQLNTLQDFIIMSLTTGYWLPPRRSEDWCKMVIKRDAENDDENYIDFNRNKFVFNSYKTSKTYEEQEVDIPKKLKKILQRYIELCCDGKYLLTTQKGNPLTSSYFTKILNKIFGCNISVSMLRHIFLTHKYKDVPKLEEMEKTAEQMGHSIMESLRYVKKS